LDGPLPKWCPAVALSRQDGRHSAVALLLKATKYSCAAILVRGQDHQTQIWFSGFRGEDLNVIFYQNMSNLNNRYKSAERKISVIGWSSSKMVSGSCALPPRWPPQCSCVVIESSFDPGERLQAPGRLVVLLVLCSYMLNIGNKIAVKNNYCQVSLVTQGCT
jgi:hypothetical protein